MITTNVSFTYGDAELSIPIRVDEPEQAQVTLILAHGAGAGMEHPFYGGFAAALAERGVRVIRFDFPYRVRGKKLPGTDAEAFAAWSAVREAASHLAGPVWVGGKSYGGRMASLAVANHALPADGLLYLGYPLHAPGKPEKPKREHLPGITIPQRFVSGTKDPFVIPHAQLEDVVAECQIASLHWVQGGNHSFEIAGNKRPPQVIGAELAPTVLPLLTFIE